MVPRLSNTKSTGSSHLCVKALVWFNGCGYYERRILTSFGQNIAILRRAITIKTRRPSDPIADTGPVLEAGEMTVHCIRGNNYSPGETFYDKNGTGNFKSIDS